MTPMMAFITAKTSPAALRLLRIIAALTGERQYQVLERVLRAELARVQEKAAE